MLSVACPAEYCIPTLSRKQYDGRKKVIEHEIWLWFSLLLLSGTLFILRTERDMIIYMCAGLLVKYPLFLWDFNVIGSFSTDFRKIFKYQISWKSVHRKALFYTDRKTDALTDMTKLIVAFHDFANAPKNCCLQDVVQDLHLFVGTNSRYHTLELFNIIRISTDTYSGSIGKAYTRNV